MNKFLRGQKAVTTIVSGLIKQLRAYLANPADHGRELVLLAGLLIVVLLLIFVGFIYISTWRQIRRLPQKPAPPFYPDPTPVARKPRDWKALGIGLLVIMGLTLIFGAVAPTQNSFCKNCHRMKPAYESWKRSTHRRVGCMQCHQEPGLVGLLSSRTAGLRNLSLRSSYAGRFRPPQVISSPTTACLGCHKDLSNKTMTVNYLRVSHGEFVGEIRCAACHIEAGHKRKETVVPIRVKEYCLNCHDGGRVSGDCPICHIGDIGARAAKRLPLSELSLTPACDGCHQIDSCRRCHRKRELPHDPLPAREAKDD